MTEKPFDNLEIKDWKFSGSLGSFRRFKFNIQMASTMPNHFLTALDETVGPVEVQIAPDRPGLVGDTNCQTAFRQMKTTWTWSVSRHQMHFKRNKVCAFWSFSGLQGMLSTAWDTQTY